MNDVLENIARGEPPRALALIVRQEGPAYRPLGAMMAVAEDGSFIGHISSGCIEADISCQSLSLENPKILRYGAGSPFVDLRLPCGGAMEVLLIPYPSLDSIRTAHTKLLARETAALSFDLETGEISQSEAQETGIVDRQFHLALQPSLRFYVFGNGLEAKVFAELTEGAGYEVALFSTNPDTLRNCRISETAQHLMTSPKIKNLDVLDEWSSITLFFHEHDLEAQILIDALKTNAFYIGAQGSFRTHQTRMQILHENGAENAERVRGPIGLIQQTRDPRTLAISVLAEIHAVAQERIL